MTGSSTFVRKIAYWILIAILLIPLSLISRPATRAVSDEGEFDPTQANQGGKLSQLRDQYDLSQAKLMDIDPTSETMKLASVGLRGLAVNTLWMQAMDHRKKENWDKLRSTLNALIKIQPNFIKVWEYQAHNLSYNISVEFDDVEYRYHWVKEGIKFLTEGIPYNYRNHRITDNLGFFCGMKIGKADEKIQFRKLFRQDSDFHEALRLDDGRGIEPDLYDTREYGHDNWRLAYRWYDKSRRLVEEFGEQYLSDMMIYRKRPMQLFSQARGLQDEFESDEIMQEIWRDAHQEWLAYGEREIRTTNGTPVTFRGLADLESRLDELRNELDEIVPGYRDAYMQEARERVDLTEIQLIALDIPANERSEEESIIAANAEKEIQKQSLGVDAAIAENAEPEKLLEARRVAQRIEQVMMKMKFSESYADTINYSYWDKRSKIEARDITSTARAAMFKAQEMKRTSIFDDEYQFDRETKEKKVVKKGAISLFEEAFDKWKVVFDDPDAQSKKMIEGEIVDDIYDACKEYWDMLRVTGKEWPINFVFQEFIDAKEKYGDYEIPTTRDIEDRESGRSDGDPRSRKLRDRARERELRKQREKDVADGKSKKVQIDGNVQSFEISNDPDDD
ncbi:MAG: hypothetical protein AAGA30_13605 [Planctomycetota bacterium]